MPTGLVYDEIFLEHGEPWHVEHRRRLEAIVSRLQAHGLWEQMEALEIVPATTEQLTWLHTEEYLEELQALCQRGGGALDADTVANWATWGAAVAAAGSCMWAVQDLLTGGVDNALCLVRPPGHHASADRGMGFCFLNNAALAAERALHLGLERVAIVDWDVHHGNGTQDLFYHRGDVMYFSIHEWGIFPGTGTVDEVGIDNGMGRNVNIPLPAYATDAHYLRAMQEIILPALRAYEPQLIIVSAGYDGHYADPLAQHSLTAAGYYELTRLLVEAATNLCEGRLSVVLEGGYDAVALALCVDNTVRALLGLDKAADVEAPPTIHAEATARVEEYLEHAITSHRLRLGL